MSMEEKYIRKMFEELKMVYGIDDSFDNFNNYKDIFIEWINSREKSAVNYALLLDYMERHSVEPSVKIAEFGKGLLDTVALELQNNTLHSPIVISPYAKTISSKYNIETYNGELIIGTSGDVIVKYPNIDDYYTNPNCAIFDNSIDTLITQLPCYRSEIKPFFKLLESDKILFIGTHGNVTDENAKDNLQKISSLYDQVRYTPDKEIYFCSETMNDTYLSALRVSPKIKVKSLVKER